MSRSILLVDDEEQTRDLLRLMLKRDGYEVFEAEDGYEALEKVKTLLPDLVLLDVMMPDIDGIAVCEQIRADAKTKSIPVVLLSAYANVDSMRRGILAGANRYLTKPIGRQSLLTNLREVFDGIVSPEVQHIRREYMTGQISQD